MSRRDRFLEMCRNYVKSEGATCEGMLAKIESYLTDPVIANRIWAVEHELTLAKTDEKKLRQINLTQSGVKLAEKVVESIEKMGFAYTYTLSVAMYFRAKGFKVERSEHKVSYRITEPEEEVLNGE